MNCDGSFDEGTLLQRCKETIEELQQQIKHSQRSYDIKEKQCITLRQIIEEMEKRLADMQQRKAIELTLKEDGKAKHKLQEELSRLREQNRRFQYLNQMLIKDKQLLSEIVVRRETEMAELRGQILQLREDNKCLKNQEAYYQYAGKNMFSGYRQERRPASIRHNKLKLTREDTIGCLSHQGYESSFGFRRSQSSTSLLRREGSLRKINNLYGIVQNGH